jgi:uncharacterized protein (TIGR02271 family)
VIDVSDLRQLVGMTLLGRSGVRVGKITEVYESAGGEGTFATVRTGLFGGQSSFVPLADAEVHGDNVFVPYPKELVDGAPRVTDDQALSPQDEDRLFAHYGLGAGAAATAAAPAGDGSMTLSEERLHVGTERVETGRARLRKYVVTETVTHTVPVSHEELRLVRERLEPGAPGVPEVTALSEEEHEVVLSAERPVVQREVVPVERIRLATETITGEETVTEQVRKEQVEVLSDAPVTERPFVSPPPAEETTTTHSELFIAPREDDAGDGGTRGGGLLDALRGESGADGTTTHSELFIAPREDEPADDGATTKLFLAPRDDHGTAT